MGTIRAPALAGVLLAAFIYGVTPENAQAQAVVDRSADFTALERWILIERSYTTVTRRQALRRLGALRRSEGVLGEVEFFLAVAGIVALADNAHSNLTMNPVYDRFGLVPIRTHWFADGLHVVRARRSSRELLGARIDSIAGLAVDDLVSRLGEYHGGTDAHFRQYFSTPLMLSPAILHAADVSDDSTRAAFSLTLPDGARRRVTLETDRAPARPGRASPWRVLVGEAMGGEGTGWVTAAPAPDRRPLALRDHTELFRYVHLPEDDVVYLQLRSNFGSRSQSARDFVESVRPRIATDGPRAVVLDNRFNPGGDLTRTAQFALDLPAMVPDDGRIYVLTSNQTFSAGIYTSFYPKMADGDKTLVVGEHVGDRPVFWAETWTRFSLPQTGYRIGYALELHDLGGCHDTQRCHLSLYDDERNLAVESIAPDVEVGMTYGDFATGRDPVLEYVLERERSRDR